MSNAEELLAKDLSLQELLEMLESKMLEPEHRNLSRESEANMAMMYLIVKATIKANS